jgi:hypothetical protein
VEIESDCGLYSRAALAVLSRFSLGHEGHTVVGFVVEHYMTDAALTKAVMFSAGARFDAVRSWADDYRHNRPETGPWHYIDIPLGESKIDLCRECPNGQCVLIKTAEFLSILQRPPKPIGRPRRKC